MKNSKFTLIDVLIIVVLLGVIAFGFVKVKDKISNGGTTERVSFTVLAKNVKEGMSEGVTIGDVVTISLKEKAYATVVGVSETEHTEAEFSPNQKKYISQVVAGKSDVYIDLECDANVTDTEILNSNAPIRVGMEAYVRGKGYAFEGFIVKVNDKQ